MNILSALEVSLTYSVPLAESPPVRSDKLMLLTKGGVLVHGVWEGNYGERYLAWAPLPKKNKLIQDFLMYMNGALDDIEKIEELPDHSIRVRAKGGRVEIWRKDSSPNGIWRINGL